ncbi:MAG: hypothetical protein II592_05280 [Muribaculaceae bacterium]|nr:hypothetical protein [Muribaculaceae bacterium]MBQ4138940.1 hypothetical protein [Muribaculaceae bacterium]
MANKRNLKKAIRYACGNMAGQCIFAESILQDADIEKWDNIILNIAMLQEEAVNRVTVSYDRTRKDFANGREYKKARRNYFKQATKSISEYMKTEAAKIAAEMNALTPKK